MSFNRYKPGPLQKDEKLETHMEPLPVPHKVKMFRLWDEEKFMRLFLKEIKRGAFPRKKYFF